MVQLYPRFLVAVATCFGERTGVFSDPSELGGLAEIFKGFFPNVLVQCPTRLHVCPFLFIFVLFVLGLGNVCYVCFKTVNVSFNPALLSPHYPA